MKDQPFPPLVIVEYVVKATYHFFSVHFRVVTLDTKFRPVSELVSVGAVF